MNIRETLFKENSKANVISIAAYIGYDEKRFKELLKLFLQDEYRVVQRAAHAISEVGDRQPQLLQKHVPALVKRMQEPGVPVAVKRNVVRALQYLNVPEVLHGDVMNTCFDLLADPKETIAVRAFSMTVLANLAIIYPDIKQELRAVIEEGLTQEPSPGFKSRALKTLKNLG